MRLLVYNMLVNVNGLYYVHVCEQAPWARSAGNSAIENLCIIIIINLIQAHENFSLRRRGHLSSKGSQLPPVDGMVRLALHVSQQLFLSVSIWRNLTESIDACQFISIFFVNLCLTLNKNNSNKREKAALSSKGSQLLPVDRMVRLALHVSQQLFLSVSLWRDLTESRNQIQVIVTCWWDWWSIGGSHYIYTHCPPSCGLTSAVTHRLDYGEDHRL